MTAASLPLTGVLVVSLERAVAAPLCTCRLADAGARVIKIERSEGDFARFYDRVALGQSSYFVWLNRSKESLALDLKHPEATHIIHRLLEQADVFLQNLAPGAAQAKSKTCIAPASRCRRKIAVQRWKLGYGRRCDMRPFRRHETLR